MQDSDKPEFTETLLALAGAHDRTMTPERIAGYWKSLQPMSVELFRSTIDALYAKLGASERAETKFPTASVIWDLSREVRRGSVPETPRKPPQDESGAPWHGDGWTANGNLLLLNHVAQNARKSAETRIDYAPDTTGYGTSMKVGPRTKHIGELLHHAALSWAEGMRTGCTDGKALWLECIGSADAKIREYLGLTTESAPF